MKQRGLIVMICVSLFVASASAQTPLTAEALIEKVREKIGKVNDYTATGKMKTNVVFIKAPIANVKVYFKKPNKVRVNNEKGISFIPKGAMNINLGNLFPTGGLESFRVIDLGKDSSKYRMITLLPIDPSKTEVKVSTLHIDETKFLIMKAQVTVTNSTYELEMKYGKYADYGLADKVIFKFNTENFKLPKGVTLDYDDGSTPKAETEAEKERRKKGKVEITYSKYEINKGVPDSVFE